MERSRIGEAQLIVYGKITKGGEHIVVAKSREIPRKYAYDLSAYAYLGSPHEGVTFSPHDSGYALLRPNKQHVMWVRYHKASKPVEGRPNPFHRDILVVPLETFTSNGGLVRNLNFPFDEDHMLDDVNLELDSVKIEPFEYTQEEGFKSVERLQNMFKGKDSMLASILSSIKAKVPMGVVGGRSKKEELEFMELFSNLFPREQRGDFTYAVRPLYVDQSRIKGKIDMFTPRDIDTYDDASYYPAFDIRGLRFNPNYQQQVKREEPVVGVRTVEVHRQLGPLTLPFLKRVVDVPHTYTSERWDTLRLQVPEPTKRIKEISTAFLNSSPQEYYEYVSKA